MKYAFNIAENRSSKISSFEIFYEVKPRDQLIKIFREKLFDKKMKFLKTKKQIRNDVINAIHMTQI